MLSSIVKELLDTWNEQVKQIGTPVEFVITTKCRVKKYYLNKTDFYEHKIAELLFIYQALDVTEKTILLYRKELRLPEKVKNTPTHVVENATIEDLYKFFLYEAIGNFGLTCRQLIINKDYSEYDIELDRLKPNPEFEGMVVETTTNGIFYEAGNQFDVFQQGDNGWHVYTEHIAGKENNGLALLPGKDCKIIVAKKVKLELV